MSLDRDCHEGWGHSKFGIVSHFWYHFGGSLFVTGFIHSVITSSCLIWRWPKIPWKSSFLIRYVKVTSLEWGWSLTKNLPSVFFSAEVPNHHIKVWEQLLKCIIFFSTWFLPYQTQFHKIGFNYCNGACRSVSCISFSVGIGWYLSSRKSVLSSHSCLLTVILLRFKCLSGYNCINLMKHWWHLKLRSYRRVRKKIFRYIIGYARWNTFKIIFQTSVNDFVESQFFDIHRKIFRTDTFCWRD
jgi:hypothetical protein